MVVVFAIMNLFVLIIYSKTKKDGYFCNFESNFCGWTQNEAGSTTNWIRKNGRTFPGPSTDQ